MNFSQPKIRRGNRDNSDTIKLYLFLSENICYDTSLELSLQDNSNEGHNLCFLWKNKENYP